MARPREPSTLGEQPPSAADRLDSWKEIAAHLKRSVRTVRRWEAEQGLPVHRHLHQNSGTVYAFKSELDTWWASRAPDLETGREPVESPLPRERRLSGRRLAVSAALAVALVSGVFAYLGLHRLGPRPSISRNRLML